MESLALFIANLILTLVEYWVSLFIVIGSIVRNIEIKFERALWYIFILFKNLRYSFILRTWEHRLILGRCRNHNWHRSWVRILLHHCLPISIGISMLRQHIVLGIIILHIVAIVYLLRRKICRQRGILGIIALRKTICEITIHESRLARGYIQRHRIFNCHLKLLVTKTILKLLSVLTSLSQAEFTQEIWFLSFWLT